MTSAVLLGVALGVVQATAEPTRVLLLYSHPPETPAIAAFALGVRETINAQHPDPVEYYEEFLDLDRFSGRERWPELERYFVEKYAGFRLDAIVTEGSAALQFASQRLSKILPGVPTVFGVAIEPVPIASQLPANVTGRIVQLPFASTANLALRLQPDLERLVIIGGLAPRDSVFVSEALEQLAPLRNRLKLVVTPPLTYDSLLTYLHRLPPRTAVLFGFFRRDDRGRYFIVAQIIPHLARASSAPMYGVLANWIGIGMLGGDAIRFEDEGAGVGRLTLRVLRRRPGDLLPAPEIGGSHYVVDSREMRRRGLDEARLPPGTELLFREASSWQRHRSAILTASAIIAAQALLIALLLFESAERKRAQREMAEQSSYEQTIAALTTDAVRHAPEEAPEALETALGRLARYAGASRAVLTQFDDLLTRVAKQWEWSSAPANQSDAGRDSSRESPLLRGPLELPLIAEGSVAGVLELYPSTRSPDWPPRLLSRLDAAGEIIAGALARSRAARSIREGELLNRAVLDSISAAIAILDSRGVIIRVNQAWRALAKLAAASFEHDPFVGHNYLEECRRAERGGSVEARRIRQGIIDILARRASSFHLEYRWASPEERWYELRVDPLDREAGGAIVTNIDITERRLAEFKADEMRRQMTHMARVAMVGELAATVSHELRQPLAAIRSNAEAGALILRKYPPDIDEALDAFQEIAEDDLRAAGIIEQIRMLLRREEPKATTVDLNEICAQAGNLLHRDASRRRAHLELVLAPQPPLVHGDPVQLQQVVLNLGLNALDAASEASTDRAVTITTNVHRDEVELAVRDTGPGLGPDIQEHLFESFFSTKTQGLGLGLSIVRTILERHHGRVHAENDLGRGAIFRVYLPRLEPRT